MLWLEPIFHIDCFISVHLSSYLLIFARVSQRKRRQLIERVATLVQKSLWWTMSSNPIKWKQGNLGNSIQDWIFVNLCSKLHWGSSHEWQGLSSFESFLKQLIFLELTPMHLWYKCHVQELQYENLLPFLPPVQGSLTLTWYMSRVQRVEDVQKALFHFQLENSTPVCDSRPPSSLQSWQDSWTYSPLSAAWFRHSTIYQYFVIYFCGEF